MSGDAVHQNGKEANYCADITGSACGGERTGPTFTLHLKKLLRAKVKSFTILTWWEWRGKL